MTENEYKKYYIQRVNNHIALVNKYARNIGKSFPNHDQDKITKLLDDYYLDTKKNMTKLTSEENTRLIDAMKTHKIESPHHPEYWDASNIDNYVGVLQYSQPFNATKMSILAMEEMCADWCAMSEEFGNTPFQWLNYALGKMFIFSDKQIDFIQSTLEEMWR